MDFERYKNCIALKLRTFASRLTPGSSEQLMFTMARLLACGSVLVSSPAHATTTEPVSAVSVSIAGRPKTDSVTVITKREGDVTHFYIKNDELCEVTVTFEMGLNNLAANKQLPCTATYPARQTTEAFTLSPIDPSAKWSFDYTNYFKLGSESAQPDQYTYELPYTPGEKFKVTQGYDGKFSHKGSNKYAIDWNLPQGTLVRAARGGMVVRVKDDSNTGGPTADYDRYNNYVLIRHDDGTLGHYCHLQQGSCLMKPGQVVATGEALARSGTTGFSSGPHLHFCVFKTKNGRERESLPVKFRTEKASATTLAEGRSYRAPSIQTASAPATAKEETAFGGGAGLQ
jgi:murein DD-endopeptidase MepM/ murein hydrolase activator NlpD